MANLFRGIPFSQPLYSEPQFAVFAIVLIKLYKCFPLIAWYGWFIYLLLFFVYLLLSVLFFRIIKKQTDHSLLKLILAALVFSLLMQEFVQRNNYTVLGCLLTGTGILYLTFKSKRPVNLLLAMVAILAGLMIRIEISIIVFALTISLALLACVANRQQAKIWYVVSGSGTCLLLTLIMHQIFYNPDEIQLNELSFYEQLVQDAHIYPVETDVVAALKSEAVQGWNQFDQAVIDQGYLKSQYKKLGINFPFIKNLLIVKLRMFYQFGNRYTGRQVFFNWWNKDLFLLAIAIFYGLIFLARASLISGSWVALIQILLLTIAVLTIAVLAKMEDRLLYPLLIVLIFFVLLNSCVAPKRRPLPLYIILLPLLAFGFYRFNECRAARLVLDEDIAGKRAFINELNKNSGKIFLFDMYTVYLLHLGPFENFNLSKKNEYAAPFHYLAIHFHSTQNYFPQKCGTDKVDEIIDCLHQKGDTVIFAYWEYNIDFLKRWNHVIYKKSIDFEPVSETNRLTGVSNAYIWGAMHHNYYILR